MAHQPPGRRRIPLRVLAGSVALGAATLALAACGAPGATRALSCGSAPATLDLLTGLEDALTPVADGDHVYVRCGGQGLRHVMLRGQAIGTSPTLRIAADLVDPDSAEALGGARLDNLVTLNVAGDSCQTPNVLVIVHVSTTDLADRPAVLSMTVTDPNGQSTRGERKVVVDISKMGCGQGL